MKFLSYKHLVLAQTNLIIPNDKFMLNSFSHIIYTQNACFDTKRINSLQGPILLFKPKNFKVNNCYGVVADTKQIIDYNYDCPFFYSNSRYKLKVNILGYIDSEVARKQDLFMNSTPYYDRMYYPQYSNDDCLNCFTITGFSYKQGSNGLDVLFDKIVFCDKEGKAIMTTRDIVIHPRGIYCFSISNIDQNNYAFGTSFYLRSKYIAKGLELSCRQKTFQLADSTDLVNAGTLEFVLSNNTNNEIHITPSNEDDYFSFCQILLPSSVFLYLQSKIYYDSEKTMDIFSSCDLEESDTLKVMSLNEKLKKLFPNSDIHTDMSEKNKQKKFKSF
jgi:hypothetical protein